MCSRLRCLRTRLFCSTQTTNGLARHLMHAQVCGVHTTHMHPQARFQSWNLTPCSAVRAVLTSCCAVPPRSTGWIVHWGEAMVDTDTAALVDHTRQILAVFRNTGSLSLYVAHGGTNFGFWAGASVT